MRLTAVASRRSIPEQYVSILGKSHIVRHNMKVCNGRHHLGVRVGIVEGGVAIWEGCRSRENTVRCAKMGDGGAALVEGRRVGKGHVFFDNGEVFLVHGNVRNVVKGKRYCLLTDFFCFGLRCGELGWRLRDTVSHVCN